MSTLTAQAAQAANEEFRARVRAAMTTGAAAVLAEAADPTHPVSAGLRTALATAVLQDAAPHVDDFAWAVATAPAVADAGTAIFSIAQTSATLPAVVGVYQQTGFAGGEIVEIDGAADPLLNGTWAVTKVNPTAFSIPAIGSLMAGPGGTVTLQATDDDISQAVSAVWNGIAGVTPANAGT